MVLEAIDKTQGSHVCERCIMYSFTIVQVSYVNFNDGYREARHLN